jgi:hypothetical protein
MVERMVQRRPGPTVAVPLGSGPDTLQAPLSARLGRYRELAQRARREASRAQGAVQESYLSLATNWDALAHFVEEWRQDREKKESASEHCSDRK